MKVLIVCKHSNSSKEAKSCKLIANNDFDIKYSWKNVLKPKDLEDVDLVVSIGGDGTALSASHFLTDRPMLAVNSDPGKSVGAITTITLNKLNTKLKKIKSGNFKTEKLERIEIFINKKLQTPLALNEVFIANEKAYLISKYKIKFNKLEEEQKSSGLIFSTGTGSTAWFNSAGGKPFSAQSRVIKMLVREPYAQKLTKFKILKKTISENEFVKIIPQTKMILAIDSIRKIKLNRGDVIKIRISNKFLERII